MVEKGSKQKSGFKLDSLADVKQLIGDVLAEARDGNDMYDSAPKLGNLLSVWLRATQMEINSEELEVRIAALEQKDRDRTLKEAMEKAQ
jgi:hypothetical protein